MTQAILDRMNDEEYMDYLADLYRRAKRNDGSYDFLSLEEFQDCRSQREAFRRVELLMIRIDVMLQECKRQQFAELVADKVISRMR